MFTLCNGRCIHLKTVTSSRRRWFSRCSWLTVESCERMASLWRRSSSTCASFSCNSCNHHKNLYTTRLNNPCCNECDLDEVGVAQTLHLQFLEARLDLLQSPAQQQLMVIRERITDAWRHCAHALPDSLQLRLELHLQRHTLRHLRLQLRVLSAIL